ncbi:MAG: glycine--tRNA ligase [Peptococcaceae bacterium]|nr:glycine--tRNA ligase [Peptococcaceae bacterium]
MSVTMEKIVALCKGRGYIFAGSEIYGGLANTWDYGPLGVELKNNIKKLWWQKFVQESPYNVGLDSAILMNPETWVASGHVGGFSDPLIDCRACKSRFRADHLIEEVAKRSVDGWSQAELRAYIVSEGIKCPKCGAHDFTDIRQFNLMFKTYQGVTDDSRAEIYLRPETAQGIFVNFRNIARTTRRKLPFGVGQIGKSFRNEITPGNFIFRTREFEQMELEFFCRPGTDLEWFAYWRAFCHEWLLMIGLKTESVRLRDHAKEELSHYSAATTDIEYRFPFGWGELWGIADRTDFDLKAHMERSKEDLRFLDPETNEKFVPYVIEPSLGVERLALALLVDAYDEEQLSEGDSRVVLRLHPTIAPIKAAILPLSKKLSGEAEKVYHSLAKQFMVEYDDAGSIGKRYRRQDEIGTPYCVTVDFETLNDGAVTVRERDSMSQVRLPIAEIAAYILASMQASSPSVG